MLATNQSLNSKSVDYSAQNSPIPSARGEEYSHNQQHPINIQNVNTHYSNSAQALPRLSNNLAKQNVLSEDSKFGDIPLYNRAEKSGIHKKDLIN
jgi:hypothetical protein